jgi:hypothetical protein
MICDIADGPAGDTWVSVCGSGGRGHGGGGLFRYRESGWDVVPVFDDVGRPDVYVSDAENLASGTDGTLWAMVVTRTQEWDDARAAPAEPGDSSRIDEALDDPLVGRTLVRYRDGRWSAFPLESPLSPEQDVAIIRSSGAVDDHGVLWFGAGDGEHGAEVLASFDGEIVRRYPAVTDIEEVSVDAEGRLWVVGWNGLHVITPEAVAAIE